MEKRPDKHRVGMAVAFTYAQRATCPRRRVGCLITDQDGRPLAVGYNGVASGRPHCIDHPCPGAKLPSGQGLDKCEAIHAEQNAILQLRDPDRARIAYVTAFPCISCIKLLIGLPIHTLVYAEAYPHEGSVAVWKEAGRVIHRISEEEAIKVWTIKE